MGTRLVHHVNAKCLSESAWAGAGSKPPYEPYNDGGGDKVY